MSGTMHELSHGSNTSKTRFNPVYIPFLALDYLIIKLIPQLPLATRVCFVTLLFYMVAKAIEPKTGIESKPEIIPTYSLNRTNLLCMLRNAETSKRGR